LRVEWDVAHLVADEQGVSLEAAQLVLEVALALRVGEESDPLGGDAEQHARCPARHARMARAIARWVLPVPGRPRRITFSRACRKSSWPRCSMPIHQHYSMLIGTGGESCGFDPQLTAGSVAGGDLGGEQWTRSRNSPQI